MVFTRLRYYQSYMEYWNTGKLANSLHAKTYSDTASCPPGRRRYPTGRRPDAKLFKASINIFAIHGAIYPMNRPIFQGDGV